MILKHTQVTQLPREMLSCQLGVLEMKMIYQLNMCSITLKKNDIGVIKNGNVSFVIFT